MNGKGVRSKKKREDLNLTGLDCAELAEATTHLSIWTKTPDLVDPEGKIVERLRVGHIEGQYCAEGTAVVRSGDAAVALLTGSVPELGLNNLKRGVSGGDQRP